MVPAWSSMSLTLQTCAVMLYLLFVDFVLVLCLMSVSGVVAVTASEAVSMIFCLWSSLCRCGPRPHLSAPMSAHMSAPMDADHSPETVCGHVQICAAQAHQTYKGIEGNSHTNAATQMHMRTQLQKKKNRPCRTQTAGTCIWTTIGAAASLLTLWGKRLCPLQAYQSQYWQKRSLCLVLH